MLVESSRGDTSVELASEELGGGNNNVGPACGTSVPAPGSSSGDERGDSDMSSDDASDPPPPPPPLSELVRETDGVVPNDAGADATAAGTGHVSTRKIQSSAYSCAPSGRQVLP